MEEEPWVIPGKCWIIVVGEYPESARLATFKNDDGDPVAPVFSEELFAERYAKASIVDAYTLHCSEDYDHLADMLETATNHNLASFVVFDPKPGPLKETLWLIQYVIERMRIDGWLYSTQGT